MRELDRNHIDYRLTTAEIFYRLPDCPELIQSYVWQEFDHAPDYPELHKFLDRWEQKGEGSLYAVYVARAKPMRPDAWRHAQVSLRVH